MYTAQGPTVVFGAFPADFDIQIPIDSLLVAGFPNADLSLLVPETVAWPEHSSDCESLGDWPAEWPKKTLPTVILQNGIEGALRRLTGFGEVTMPGLGQVIAAGPILAALAGVTAGFDTMGCADSFIGMGMPANEAERYEHWISKGSSLISILCENVYWDTLAMGILIATQAEDIFSTRSLSRVRNLSRAIS
ncbi:MAG TPA: hypothetical protein VKR82_11790 [Candidatus Acidoferrales bacterium]|nr:hypothetical protein [Candidatus Acidoferrales bacterium]